MNFYDKKLLKKNNGCVTTKKVVKKGGLNLGVTEMTFPFGMKIKVYDIERTICDIIKNKNLSKPTQYAKAMNIEKKVSEYMEVLL